MSTTLPDAREWTAADLVERFGPIPLSRIRHDPLPGTATEQDVIDVHAREGKLYELVDGVLVEKTVGTQESYLALVIGSLIHGFVAPRDLGFVLGADGMARLNPGLVRIPDVSFVSWNRIGCHTVPDEPMLRLAPDLAVEVLSPSNTAREMEGKLDDYFEAGVQLVWYVDPRKRTVQVFTAPDECTTLGDGQVLRGEPVLPGFELSIDTLFARIDQE
jgi:Uma2 family endonuclease